MANSDIRSKNEETAYEIALTVISNHAPWIDLNFADFRKVARMIVDSLAEVELIAE